LDDADKQKHPPEGMHAHGLDRREILAGLAAAGVLGALGSARAATAESRTRDAALHSAIDTVVVIYAENRSFNNLFADFPGLQRPLSAVPREAGLQRDRDGRVFDQLPVIWKGLVPDPQVVEHTRYHIQEGDIRGLANGAFVLKTPDGDPLPMGLVTRDLIHAFYNNQLQINGGRNDGFVAWGDSGALVMGRYGDSAVNLRLWKIAQEFTLCDNFFMGAFGGSFLNHQYLVAAQPPFYPNAASSPARSEIAEVEGDDPTGIRLKLKPESPRSALDGPPVFGRNALTPDFWAVNTMGPAYSPGLSVDPQRPDYADPASPRTLVPQTHATIVDRLSAAGVDWAWYAGAWGAALARAKDDEREFPAKPNFQEHHQPLNYFARFAPGTPDRAKHLRDAGLGETARTNHFLADIEAGRLPPVSFYKPQGNLNMHAGYSDVDSGDRHIARVIDALRDGPQWSKMLVIITVDENGGWWDHVAPPKGDRWGPGNRVPAIIVSPHARRGAVDHTIYDTGSISRFLTRRFALQPLPGLVGRAHAMVAAGGPPPGDLTAALALS
jgi:acid phosphatase